jgi:hypothetical protein
VLIVVFAVYMLSRIVAPISLCAIGEISYDKIWNVHKLQSLSLMYGFVIFALLN